MSKGPIALAIAIAATCVFSTPSEAALNRVWISGKGTDTAGCGPVATPCRTLQYAHDQVAASGEIDIADGAGYGSVIITKTVSIVNDWAGMAGVLQSGGGQNAITINAGATDKIHLRGLSIDGLNNASTGVQVNSAQVVEIVNCVVRRFNSSGVVVMPSTGTTTVAISDLLISDVAGTGLVIIPQGSATVNGLIKRSSFNVNGSGLSANAQSSTGRVNVVVEDSTATGNGDAFIVDSSNSTANSSLILERVAAAGNTGSGLRANTRGVATIRQSNLSRNGIGVNIGGLGVVKSSLDNLIIENGTDVAGTLGTAPLK